MGDYMGKRLSFLLMCLSTIAFAAKDTNFRARAVEVAATFEIADIPTEFLAASFYLQSEKKSPENLAALREQFARTKAAISSGAQKEELEKTDALVRKMGISNPDRVLRVPLETLLTPDKSTKKTSVTERAKENLQVAAALRESRRQFANEYATNPEFRRNVDERVKNLQVSPKAKKKLDKMKEAVKEGEGQLTPAKMKKIMDDELASNAERHAAKHLKESESLHKAANAILDLADFIIPEEEFQEKKIAIEVARTAIEAHEILEKLHFDNTISKLGASADLLTLCIKLGITLYELENDTKSPEELILEKLEKIDKKIDWLGERGEINTNYLSKRIDELGSQLEGKLDEIQRDLSIIIDGNKWAQVQNEKTAQGLRRDNMLATSFVARQSTFSKSIHQPDDGLTPAKELNRRAAAIAFKGKTQGLSPEGSALLGVAKEPGVLGENGTEDTNFSEALADFAGTLRKRMGTHFGRNDFSDRAINYALAETSDLSQTDSIDNEPWKKFSEGHFPNEKDASMPVCTGSIRDGIASDQKEPVPVEREFFSEVYKNFIPDSLKELQAVDGGKISVCIEKIESKRLETSSYGPSFITTLAPKLTLRISYKAKHAGRVSVPAFSINLEPHSNALVYAYRSVHLYCSPRAYSFDHKKNQVFIFEKTPSFLPWPGVRGKKEIAEELSKLGVGEKDIEEIFDEAKDCWRNEVALTIDREEQLESHDPQGNRILTRLPHGEEFDKAFRAEVLQHTLGKTDSMRSRLYFEVSNPVNIDRNRVKVAAQDLLLRDRVEPSIAAVVKKFFPGDIAKLSESDPEVYMAAQRLIGAYKLLQASRKNPSEGKEAEARIEAILKEIRNTGSLAKLDELVAQFEIEVRGTTMRVASAKMPPSIPYVPLTRDGH